MKRHCPSLLKISIRIEEKSKREQERTVPPRRLLGGVTFGEGVEDRVGEGERREVLDQVLVLDFVRQELGCSRTSEREDER